MAACILITLSVIPLQGFAQVNHFSANSVWGLTPIKPKTIAVIQDGPSSRLNQYLTLMKKELAILTDDKLTVRYKVFTPTQAKSLPAIKQSLKQALRDPGVDLIFANGILVSGLALQPDVVLTKPVISNVLLNRDMVEELPILAKTGRKKNLGLVLSQRQLSKDIQLFQDMVGFKQLYIVGNPDVIRLFPGIDVQLQQMTADQGITIAILPEQSSAQATLGQLPTDAEAVLLTPSIMMTDAQQQAFIDGLNARKIPTFTFAGRDIVEKGVLATMQPDLMERMSRRVALSLYRVMVLDEIPADLPLYLPMNEQLLINAATVQKLELSLKNEYWLKAEVLNWQGAYLYQGERLTLDEAMKTAKESQIDVTIAKTQTESLRQEKNIATTRLLPQVTGEFQESQIDKDQAQATAGAQPQQSGTLSLTVQQMIYDDSLVSNLRALMKNVKGQEWQQASTQLDAMQTAGKRFIEVLSAQRLLQIEVDNLNLTRENLNRAKLRQQIGSAGPEEVYRWEVEIARQQGNVIERAAAVDQSRVALNQSLGLTQTTKWTLEDLAKKQEQFYFLGKALAQIVTNEDDFKVFENYAVQVAFDKSPQLKALGKNIGAQKILVGQARRKFFVPNVNFQGQWNYRLHENTSGISAASPIIAANQNTMRVAAVASYPIFQGGGRVFGVKKAKADLNQQLANLEKARQLIEQEVRSRSYTMDSAAANIKLQRLSAESAQRNLEVIQQKYAQGAEDIIKLIDAQNETFTANQQAAIAIYGFLQEWIDFQRAISWFETDMTDEEKIAWIDTIQLQQNQQQQPQGTGATP
ncbi:MAG: TolC family protein [Vampirovibrio sp.]|nr:TolC family protein [Vampirovibrio sp.]